MLAITKEQCLAYLAGSTPTEQQKQIAIYAMEYFSVEGYINFAQACYQLYKKEQLSEALFQLVLSFELVRVHPLVKPPYYPEKVHTFLQQVQEELGPDTPIGLQIEEILSGRLAKEWERKGPSPYLHYIHAWHRGASTEETYQEFIEILGQAAKDWEAFMYCPWEPEPHSHPPYFLMMLEHPGYYLSLGNLNNLTFLRCLQDPD